MAAALPSMNTQKRGKGADGVPIVDAYATPCFVPNDGESNQSAAEWS
jgi:hypothetical protein